MAGKRRWQRTARQALGGGLGGGVIGECRAAIFLPARAAQVKASAASPRGGGMVVGALSTRAFLSPSPDFIAPIHPRTHPDSVHSDLRP